MLSGQNNECSPVGRKEAAAVLSVSHLTNAVGKIQPRHTIEIWSRDSEGFT